MDRTRRILVVLITVAATLLTTLSLPAQAASTPGKPVAKLTSGSSRVVLSWVAPASNGSTITSYQVVSRKYAAGKWRAWSYYNLTRTYRSKSVTYLNGTKVQTKVRAKSAKGFGSWSTVLSTVAGLPNAPTSRSVARANKSLTVSWGAAAGNGSAITAYRVYARSQVGGVWGAWTYATTSGSIRTKTFGSLAPGKKYQFYIRAGNYWGYGPSTSTLSTVVLSAPNARAISAEGFHTCALLTPGGVKCWGENGFGQLGNGTNAFSSGPVNVIGLSSGVSAISAGGGHTCALLTTGGVKCWGFNGSGQLGYPTSIVSGPVDVSGLSSGVSAISAGPRHTCALLTTGGVKCWGANGNGELGNGTDAGQSGPVDVSGLSSGVSAISVGGYHTCALLITGGVKCWGQNFYGQLGNGTTIKSTTPVDVTGLSSGVSAISAGAIDFYGDHTCALLITGGVKCWGKNGAGQLGNGTTTDSYTPVNVSGLSSGVSAINAGGAHTCALLTTGGAKCWGSNGSGQLGNGTTTDSYTPVNVSGLSSGVSAISAGEYHTCALLITGGAKCWGDAGFQLFDGIPTDSRSSVPVDVIFSQ